MAEVIEMFGRNGLGYSHVVCTKCGGNEFRIETDELDGIAVWCFVHCVGCGNYIPVDMTPLYGPSGGVM